MNGCSVSPPPLSFFLLLTQSLIHTLSLTPTHTDRHANARADNFKGKVLLVDHIKVLGRREGVGGDAAAAAVKSLLHNPCSTGTIVQFSLPSKAAVQGRVPHLADQLLPGGDLHAAMNVATAAQRLQQQEAIAKYLGGGRAAARVALPGIT